MKTILKIAVVAISLVFMLIGDVPFLALELVPEADAILGVRRRTARRTAVVVGSGVHASDQAKIAASQQQAAAAQQQAATAQQQSAAAQQQAVSAPPPAAPPAAAGKPLPLGTVVPTLPGGCVSTPVGGVEYY